MVLPPAVTKIDYPKPRDSGATQKERVRMFSNIAVSDVMLALP
jgi:hypothetical protein